MKKFVCLLLACLCFGGSLRADIVCASVDGFPVPPHAIPHHLTTDSERLEYLSYEKSWTSYEAAIYEGEIQYYWVLPAWNETGYRRVSKMDKLKMIGSAAIWIFWMGTKIYSFSHSQQASHGWDA